MIFEITFLFDKLIQASENHWFNHSLITSDVYKIETKGRYVYQNKNIDA